MGALERALAERVLADGVTMKHRFKTKIRRRKTYIQFYFSKGCATALL